MSTNDGTGVNWVTTEPTDSDPIGSGAREIRDLRLGVNVRLQKEHVAAANGSVGGEHKAGSAIAYFQTSEPTDRPDGATALDTDDAGRLWIDTDGPYLYLWNTTDWVPVLMSVGDVIGEFGSSSIANDAITTAKIADNAITQAKMADGSVGTAEIIDANVTAAKLASDAVTTAKIADAQVTFAKLAAGTVRISVGTYSGNGTTTNAVTGLGFTPKFVFISKPDGSNISFSFKSYGSSPTVMRTTADSDVNSAIAWDSDGFTLKSGNDDFNGNSKTYHYFAVG